MNLQRRIDLAHFMANQFVQTQLQRVSMRTGRVVCKPTSIYGMITSRCDLRCVMCDWWKRPALDEMPTEGWLQALSNLRDWLGPFHINFNGGEIFLREDMVEILDFAGRKGIMAGFVTNAFHLDRELTRAIIRTNPFNFNISLDGVERTTHDGLRGTKGCFDRVHEVIDYIIEFKGEYRADSRVIIKPTVMMRNLSEMPDLVRWVQQKGGMSVNFQPVIPTWTKGAAKQFTLQNGKLDAVVDELVLLKREGAPILNPIAHLESFKSYFRNEALPIFEKDLCYVGVKNFFIHPSGDVYLCEHDYGPVGNIAEQHPRDIWNSAKADWSREQIRNCRRSCLQTCTVKRSLRENVELFQNLVLRS
jgi:radical SAM protein with 4Fe4S-binding SPASM domain